MLRQWGMECVRPERYSCILEEPERRNDHLVDPVFVNRYVDTLRSNCVKEEPREITGEWMGTPPGGMFVRDAHGAR